MRYIRQARLMLLCLTSALDAQEQRDTTGTQQDTIVYRLQGILVEMARPVIVSGGASAVEVRLDSLDHPPSPTLSESLRQLPLVRVRQNSRGQVQPSLRGMEEREIAVLVDGVPITIGWDNRTDLSVVPLTGATRLTIVRGLSSVLAGPNALGGVLEIGMASDLLPREPPDPLQMGIGMDDTGAFSLAAESGRLWRDREEGRGFFLRYGGGFRTSPGSALSDGLPSAAKDDGLLLNSDRDYLNGFVTGRWQEGSGESWVSFSSMAFRAERGVTPELHLLGSTSPSPRFWRIPNHWRSVSAISAGTGWHRTPLGEGDLEISVGMDLQHMEIDAFDSPAYADSVDGETGDDRTLTVRLVGDHTAGPGVLRGAVTMADTKHDQILEDEPTESFQQRLWSFGLEMEQPILRDRPLGGSLSHPSITVGVSLDGVSNPLTGSYPGQEGIWGWGARASTRAVFWEGKGTVHGGLSRKVRFPALREMFSGALGKFMPNPDLEPLTLKVLELGTTLQPGWNLEIQGTLFAQRLEGSIVRVVVEGGMFQRQNRGETRAIGAELVGSWRWEGISFQGDLTLQDVTLRDDDGNLTGERPEYQPEFAASFRVDAPVGMGLRARAGVEHIGSQYGANALTDAFDTLKGTTAVDVGVSRTFEKAGNLPPFRLSLSVSNLLDEAIYDQLGLPRPGRTISLRMDLL